MFFTIYLCHLCRLGQIVSGLKSRDEEARERSGMEMQQFVRTELREAASDQQPMLMDELIRHIFDLVNSTDVNEKKVRVCECVCVWVCVCGGCRCVCLRM